MRFHLSAIGVGAAGLTLLPWVWLWYWKYFIISLALSFYLGRKSFVHELELQSDFIFDTLEFIFIWPFISL
jgi:hypothetical protein